jgi:hypothetical protein
MNCQIDLTGLKSNVLSAIDYIGLDIQSKWIVLKYRKKVLDAKFHGKIPVEKP